MNYERSSQKWALQTGVWMAQSVGLHKVQIKHPQSEPQVLGQERCIFIYLLFWGKFKTSFSIHLEDTEDLLEMLDTLNVGERNSRNGVILLVGKFRYFSDRCN